MRISRCCLRRCTWRRLLENIFSAGIVLSLFPIVLLVMEEHQQRIRHLFARMAEGTSTPEERAELLEYLEGNPLPEDLPMPDELAPGGHWPAMPDAEATLEALRRRGWTVATAESCTGGLIAGALTEVAGPSDVVGRGFGDARSSRDPEPRGRRGGDVQRGADAAGDDGPRVPCRGCQ